MDPSACRPSPCCPSPCRWTVALPVADGRRALAAAGERAAATHLTAVHGLTVVATNLRVAIEELRGELDVVATDGRGHLLVVCEVKARSRSSHGGAAEALGARQRARIRRMTAALLATGTLRGTRIRFDVVTAQVATGPGPRTATLAHRIDAW